MRSFAIFITALLINLILMMAPLVVQGDSSVNSTSMVKADWYVEGTERFDSEVIDVTGNVTVNGTLILDNTDLYFNGSGFRHSLHVNGPGRVILKNDSRILFRTGTSYYIFLRENSTMELFRSYVMGAGYGSPDDFTKGIYGEGAYLDLNNSQITIGYSGVISNNSNVDINNSQIINMAHSGLVLKNSTGTINNTNVSGCVSKGINLQRSNVSFEFTRVRECKKGLYSINSTILMKNCQLSGIDSILMVLNSTKMDMVDSFFPVPGNDRIFVEFPVGKPTQVFLLNTTPGKIFVEDENGSVEESYRHDIRVLTNKEAPAKNSTVVIKDPDGMVEFSGIVDERGLILDIPLVERTHNVTGRHSNDPHNITIRYGGAKRISDLVANASYMSTFNVILTDPEVVIESPINNTWIAASNVQLKGYVNHTRPLDSVRYFIDLNEVTGLGSKDGFDVKLDFPDGMHTFAVVATNDDGRSGNDLVSFGVDTIKPVLNIEPLPSETNRSVVWIRGTCSEDEAVVRIGEDMVSHTGGSFEFAFALEEGRNEILITARDRAGNEDRETVAHKITWSAVKQKYKKEGENWVSK